MITPNKERCVAHFLEGLRNQAPRFQIGDVITFVCAKGWHHCVSILDIWSCGHVTAMVYDGQPHHLDTTLADLERVRVVKLEFRMGPEEIEMYMSILGIHYEMQEAA